MTLPKRNKSSHISPEEFHGMTIAVISGVCLSYRERIINGCMNALADVIQNLRMINSVRLMHGP